MPGPQGGVAMVWRLSDGKKLYSVDIDDGYGSGFAAAFSPDGKLLATGGGDGVVKFWDAKTGKPNGRTFIGNPGWVRSVAFDPTGRLLLTAGTDGLTRLWDVKTRSAYGAPLPGHEGFDNHAAFSPDGSSRRVRLRRRHRDRLGHPPSLVGAASMLGRGPHADEGRVGAVPPGRGYHPACKS